MELAYSDKEIIKSYMKNPTEEQIQILSELNCCYKSDIIHLLSCYGINKENSRKRVYVNRTVYKEPKKEFMIDEQFSESLINYVKERRSRLEFLCLSNPKEQRKYFDEMQVLMGYLNDYNAC